jgi:hypothetical protein
MRYAAVAKFNREQSLHAMWQAFRARSFADQQLVELDAGVVRDLLNARYYESTRGQFLSEDPSFLAVGDPNAVKQVTGQDQRTFLSDPQQMNSTSYGRAIPIYYGAITAPEWAPPVVAGILAAGAYITADMSLRNNGGLRWGGTVPTLDPAKMGFGPPPSGPEDWRPNLDNKPKWMKTIAIGGLVTMGGAELAEPMYKLYNSLTTRSTQAQRALNSQLNSASIQTRYQATQSYNAATGASTPQTQLWVTPNGAVVSWSGQVVAPAPSKTSSSSR